MQIIAKLCINEIYELNHEWKHKIFKSQSLLVFDYLVHSNGTNKRKTLLQIINIQVVTLLTWANFKSTFF